MPGRQYRNPSCCNLTVTITAIQTSDRPGNADASPQNPATSLRMFTFPKATIYATV